MPKDNLTTKQRKFLDILSENVGNKKPKSIYQMLLEAGYSESIAKQQSNVLNSDGIQENLNDIVNQLEEARQEAINRLSEEVSDAKYKDLVNSIDKLTKNVELLSGRDTQRVDLSGYKDLSDEELAKLIKEGQGGVGEEGAGE